ncbi:MAG TPA: hypothetical protein VK420_04040 [Longimicrobium sp.]|nr:hypothetical protein [Longimicrobium sp.]
MTGGASLPGPPPLPPADLSRRALPIGEVPAGTILCRIHRTAAGVPYFGPRTDPRQRGRWDAPNDGYGVCYLEWEGRTAFSGTLLCELDREEVSVSGDLAPRSLARVEVKRPLLLARMHGPGLRQMRATAAVVQGSYDLTWAWSHAVHEHPHRVDGIMYRAARRRRPCRGSLRPSP